VQNQAVELQFQATTVDQANVNFSTMVHYTVAAENEGAAIKIAAAAEMEAARLRGQGVAAFRRKVAQGMAKAALAMEDANLDPSFVLFAMWTEAIRHFAAEGTGNLITIDGSVDGMSTTIRQMMAAGHFIGNPLDATDGVSPPFDAPDGPARAFVPPIRPS